MNRLRYGWTVEWLTRNKVHGSYESESIKEVQAKEREVKGKGYRVTGIYQCIF